MKIIECPRDAMQGIAHFIPTEKKIAYINQLLKVGFDTIDFGSFVSPKVIPQMKDTWKIVNRLNLEETNTKLLAIVANVRGAEDSFEYEQIDYLVDEVEYLISDEHRYSYRIFEYEGIEEG